MRPDLKAGDKHGYLTAVARVQDPRRGAHWLFKCQCGGEFVCRGDRVVCGNTIGCPACRSARISATSTHHGACANYETTRLYTIWRAMRFRCRTPHARSWHNYGGKGIRVCAEWEVFDTFRHWALQNGYEAGLTIDRLDGNDNYRPGNCEWVTRAENARRAMALRPIKKLPKGYRGGSAGFAQLVT